MAEEGLEEQEHLLAELQVVLADKAALEEEKAAAQAEAAAAQRSFERSRLLLEAQLCQLGAAISSQETLIAKLQSNEAEARSMGALYLDRCRELETELAELNLEMDELTSALAQVEADAAASAEEKARLRSEYEARLRDVAAQMSSLQRQLKGQDGLRIERERQRAAGRVQQLQAHLAAMRIEQESTNPLPATAKDVMLLEKERQRAAGRVQQLQAHLAAMRIEQEAVKRRLGERLAAQEKAAADKAKELAALRRAAEAAKRRVAELEDENRRQRAALRSRSEEAVHAQREAVQAQRQVKQLSAQAALLRSRQSSPCPHRSLSMRHSAQRRSSDECAGSSSSSSSSSSNSSSEADALNPAEQCLLEGLTDQLDAADAELEHLGQQQQQQQAAVAAADAAAAALRSRVDGLSSRQLAQLLQQALDLLVEQGGHWQDVLHKVRGA
ncbi:hypothetical protein OEZ86_008375 [Tetradesmus obliquus]|nr:hypothetical protein OEZ86_008375 [Tetradesmus obliquus]